MGKLSGTFYGVPRSSRHRQSPFSGIGHLWRTGMLNGIHHRLLIQIGNDSYDIYDVCGILHCSWQWSVCGKRTCICLFGGICIDVYYRTGKICRRPLDFPISFSQIEINKALLFYRILFFCSFFNVYVIKMVIFALVYINIEILSQ